MHSKNIYLFNFFTLAIICWLFSTCKSAEELNDFDIHVKDKNYQLTLAPPDGIKVANNLYYDQEDVTNINWREYMYWTEHVYGYSSPEYKATFPDTLVWVRLSLLMDTVNCLNWFVYYYLRSPTYQDYPVVGITQEQAEMFTKWRSDRVMEYLLVANKIIVWDTAPKPDTYFTIERYFRGKYKNILPNSGFMYYPDFRLPTISEWHKGISYNDSITNLFGKQDTQRLWLDIKPCRHDTLFCAPTEKCAGGVSPAKNSLLNNMHDNVSAWATEDGVCLGGGWHDKESIILKQDTFHRNWPNAWTGFRNVCEWKKWTK